MHDMIGTLCKLASDLVKDDVGRVVLDAAVTRACPNHRIALLKAVDYSHVAIGEESAAAVKEVRINACHHPSLYPTCVELNT
jgi:hypothetical protein